MCAWSVAGMDPKTEWLCRVSLRCKLSCRVGFCDVARFGVSLNKKYSRQCCLVESPAAAEPFSLLSPRGSH